ncbi:acyltransferase family protein [Bradyrhizobium guangdongense]|uniref:acyltransferase family protein n=1 Tax=Bradyrhizobium guangdongense TaxID=1325090 RepID=UPI001319E9C4|nr:acyltransferase [Bradyrhizobium guangdongense]
MDPDRADTKLMQGKTRNNFNILRLVAATLVIFSHGVELPTGARSRDWAFYLTGQPLSWYAVNLFFIVSGYLIFASWHSKPSVVRFAKARILRIVPGLAVMLVLSLVVLGCFFSTLDFPDFISSGDTLKYFVGCLSVVFVQMNLPGVFEQNPISAVNGSLWTLRYEVFCYGMVAALGSIGLLSTRRLRRSILCLTTMAALVATIWIEVYVQQPSGLLYIAHQCGRLGFCFLLGGLVLEFKPRVPFKGTLALSSIAIAASLIGTWLFSPVATVSLAYVAFWFAFIPDNRHLELARKWPDYSYGLYIYAFPVQQAIVATIENPLPSQVTTLGLVISLGLAALSWHCVEKRALALKNVRFLQRQFAGARLSHIELRFRPRSDRKLPAMERRADVQRHPH